MSEITIIKKPRIEYIDLAKGICIIIVVMLHLSAFYTFSLTLVDYMMAFAMPLYFFLSGCFFKTYDGFSGYFKRKVNKLLIPFLFFYALTSVCVPYIQVYLLGCKTSILRDSEIITAIFTESYPNLPLWFLLCLFEVSLFFYTIYIFAQRFEGKSNLVLCIVSLLFGVIGVIIKILGINLLANIDTAISATPFFAAGYWIFQKTEIMKPNRFDKLLPILIVLALAFVMVFRPEKTFFRNLNSPKPSLFAYLCAFGGIYGIVMLSKIIKRLPLVSYFGRYSLIILVTHIEVFNLFAAVIKYSGLNLSQGWVYFINLSLTMLSYLVIIPLMNKFMPHVIGQKDVIQIKK